MSNPSKDHTSTRVHVPPGGHCSNIFGTNPEETHTRAGTIANQYKQTQMKSNIFETDEPAPARSVSNKNKSNVFGSTDDEQNKRQSGVRQGLRVGYNPINGESYSMADNLNSKNSCKLPTVRLYEVVETWKKINHANIAQLREVFLTKDFNDDQPSIVFVYDFVPCCETLQKRHFSSNNNLLKGWSNPYNISGEDRPFSAGKGTNQTGLLAEALIWEYVVQISALIRTLHAASLSCRCLHLSRILVDGDSKAGRAKSRLWLSGVGIADILDGNINASVQQHI
ncbi:unnamed protein product, partial [Rotaria sordida]